MSDTSIDLMELFPRLYDCPGPTDIDDLPATGSIENAAQPNSCDAILEDLCANGIAMANEAPSLYAEPESTIEDVRAVASILHSSDLHVVPQNDNPPRIRTRVFESNYLKSRDRVKEIAAQEAAQSGMKVLNGETFQCHLCQETFAYRTILESHIITHRKFATTGNRPYKCTRCKKAFKQHCHLQVHLRWHSGDKPYTCQICNKTFKQKPHLNNHMRLHSGLRPFVCAVCGKTFTQSAHLNSHRMLHTGWRPYECTVCAKSFTQSSQLRTHMRMHTGERPYTCNVCGKRFTQRGNLIAHERLHKDGKTPSRRKKFGPLARRRILSEPQPEGQSEGNQMGASKRSCSNKERDRQKTVESVPDFVLQDDKERFLKFVDENGRSDRLEIGELVQRSFQQEVSANYTMQLTPDLQRASTDCLELSAYSVRVRDRIDDDQAVVPECTPSTLIVDRGMLSGFDFHYKLQDDATQLEAITPEQYDAEYLLGLPKFDTPPQQVPEQFPSLVNEDLQHHMRQQADQHIQQEVQQTLQEDMTQYGQLALLNDGIVSFGAEAEEMSSLETGGTVLLGPRVQHVQETDLRFEQEVQDLSELSPQCDLSDLMVQVVPNQNEY